MNYAESTLKYFQIIYKYCIILFVGEKKIAKNAIYFQGNKFEAVKGVYTGEPKVIYNRNTIY